MFPTTHAHIGDTTGVLLLQHKFCEIFYVNETNAFLMSLAVGVFFGILPDYDFIFKHLKSQIYYLENHRKTSHSIFLHLIISSIVPLILYFYIENTNNTTLYLSSSQYQYFGFSIFIILFSHVFLDALTSWGVYYFYPFKYYSSCFLPKKTCL